MTANRRDVIALGGVALGLGMSAAVVPATAQAARRTGGQHPTNLTYATIESNAGGLGLGLGLGLRTQRGIVDVAAYEKAQKRGLPTTVEQVIAKDGDLAALSGLAASARASRLH